MCKNDFQRFKTLCRSVVRKGEVFRPTFQVWVDESSAGLSTAWVAVRAASVAMPSVPLTSPHCLLLVSFSKIPFILCCHVFIFHRLFRMAAAVSSIVSLCVTMALLLKLCSHLLILKSVISSGNSNKCKCLETF